MPDPTPRPGGPRQYVDAMRSQAPGRGKISTLCALGCLAMAGFCRDAFPGGNPWQFFRSMHPRRGPGREKRPSLARFARHASETSWLWQDMRAVYPKSPANRLLGMHRAKILPGRGPFRCTDPSNHARRASLAIRRRRSTLAPATPAPPNSASRPQQHTALMARQPSERATRRSAKPPERSQPRLRRTAPNRPQPLRRSATREPTA